jgi:crotonobetainyl-CoA:carnitine CoA-transferase CaiB-like acyl-CoA transferase
VPEGPFAGVRVLELTSAGAGRTAGMLLADLGADVARIPPGGRVPTGWTPEDLCLDYYPDERMPRAITSLR